MPLVRPPIPEFLRSSIRSAAMVSSLPLGTDGILDASLPRVIFANVYARTGDMPTGLRRGGAVSLVLRQRAARLAKTCRLHRHSCG